MMEKLAQNGGAISVIAVKNGRFDLPAGFAADGGHFVVTASPVRSLLLFPTVEWLPIRNRLLRQTEDDGVRCLRRLLVGFAHDMEIERSGTIELTSDLLQYADIQNEILWIPSGRGVELWSPAVFNKDWRSILF